MYISLKTLPSPSSLNVSPYYSDVIRSIEYLKGQHITPESLFIFIFTWITKHRKKRNFSLKVYPVVAYSTEIAGAKINKI